MRRAGCLLLALASGACRGPGGPDPEDFTTEVRFLGERAVPEEELLGVAAEELFDRPGVEPTKIEVDDAAFAVELSYRARGFPDARVEYELVAGPPPLAVFLIEEGPHYELAAVELQGARGLAAEELVALFPAPGSDYVVGDVQGAASALEDFYLQSGFLRVAVAEPDVRLDPAAGTAHVRVAIEEGPRFVLRAIRIDGPGGHDLSRAEASLGRSIGQPYTRRLAARLRAELVQLEADRGFPDAEVELEAQEDEESGAVSLVFTVRPGVRVRVTGVRLEGNEEVDDEVILERLAIEPGDLHRSSRVRESFRRLYETGLFQRVAIDLEGEGTERTLVVDVDERPSLELRVEPGYGSYEGPRLVLGIAENDLFGTARRLRLDSAVGALAQRAKVELVEPWLLDTDLTAGVDVFANRREEPSFTSVEAGTGLTFTRRWTSSLRTSLGYRYRATRLDDVEVLTPEALELDQSVDVSSVAFTVEYDTTRDPFAARQGSRSRAQVEWASRRLGSEIEFVGAALVHSRYFALGERTVLAVTGRGGAILPTAGDEIPLQLRLFLGGENSVRSYEEQQLGPKDTNGEPIGGELYALGSIELRRDLFGALSGAVFVDAGYVDARDLDEGTVTPLSLESSSDGGMALGLGLRYLLPIGHVRLDGALNPNPGEDEDEIVVHLAVGMAF